GDDRGGDGRGAGGGDGGGVSKRAARRGASASRPGYTSLMAPENFENSLKALRQRQPFRPFTVELVSGDRFEVDFPDALVIRDGAAVYLAAGGIPVIFDHEGVSQVIGDLMGQSES